MTRSKDRASPGATCSEASHQNLGTTRHAIGVVVTEAFDQLRKDAAHLGLRLQQSASLLLALVRLGQRSRQACRSQDLYLK
jgi:hypothetical protein